MHWIVPTTAGVFLATSILLIFVGYLNYLTDTYLMYAASALAANTVARSGAGAAAPLFTQYMFDALGVGGGGSLIAGVATLLAPIPFIFYKYGEPIRKRSKFAPTPDKEDEPRQEGPRERQSGTESESEVSGVDSDPYRREGGGIDGQAISDDKEDVDVEKMDGPPRSKDPEKDLEKGEL